MTKINKSNRIENLTYGEFFNVMLHNGDNPAIELAVDFTGMPVETLVKLAYDTMKVKFRPHVKGMGTEAFLKAFNHQTITWREMITKSGASSKIAIAEKSPEEVVLEITRLQASLKKMRDNKIDNNEAAANNDAVDNDNDNNDNDITSDNYIPENS